MTRISTALISNYVGKTLEDTTYSFVFNEAYCLAKRGVDINIIRPTIEKPFFSYDMHFYGFEKRVDIRALLFLLKNLKMYPPISLTRIPSITYFENLYASNVSRIVEHKKIDLIHAHFAYPEGLIGLLVKRKTKKPLLVTLHGYDILVEPSLGYGARLDRRFDAIIRQVLNNADIVFAASNATFLEAVKIVKDNKKVHLVPNGIDIERFNPYIETSGLKKKLGLDKHTIIFTLRNHNYKYGIEYLIRAAAIVNKRINNVVFIIGGDGHLRKYHEQLAIKLEVNKSVIFTGKIPHDKVPLYYAMSDVVVVPSLQEAFGLVVAEAMACGKPVIGTNIGGIPDQIVDGYNGFLVTPKSPSEIAKKIFWLFENPDDAKRMGHNARKTVEEKFDIKNRVKTIITFYEKLL